MKRLGVERPSPLLEPGLISRMRAGALRLFLVAAAVLAVLYAGGSPAGFRSAADVLLPGLRQAPLAAEEWHYKVFLPLVTGTRPLRSEERYGFVATSLDWRQTFDVAKLGAGWYVDASPLACSTSPGGMDRALLIHVRNWQSSPQWEWLESMVNAHPGSLWLVGNEPDCIWQDNLLPEEYAVVYHDIYTAITGWDSTALVSPGGIVQPTPLRLQWLDRVLAAFETEYGEQMPVHVWNIHNAILREVSSICDPANAWGADIPPGFDECQGVWREVEDNYRVDIFEEQVWTFREWMASRGYAGYPLVISEFGVLMPVGWAGFDEDDVNAFMDATFEFLRTARSDNSRTLGDPSDGHRLVQRWAWFSLDTPPYNPENPIPDTFNGNLFDPYTTDITGYGLNFAMHTEPLPALNYIDLRPGGLRFEPLGPVGVGELVTRRVNVEVRNLGSLDSGAFGVRLAYTGPSSDELQQTVNVPAGSSTWLEFDLVQLEVGAYRVTVSVDANDDVLETTECDNLLETTMLVPFDLAYLPLIVRNQ